MIGEREEKLFGHFQRKEKKTNGALSKKTNYALEVWCIFMRMLNAHTFYHIGRISTETSKIAITNLSKSVCNSRCHYLFESCYLSQACFSKQTKVAQ